MTVNKRMLSKISLVLIMLAFLNIVQDKVVKADAAAPEITFVGIEHSPLVAGDKETFYITAKGADKVQYRVYLYSEKNDEWQDLTKGFTDLVDPSTPYIVRGDKAFEVGSYKLSVLIRAGGSIKEYDNSFISGLNCVEKDDNNRVYADGNLNIGKEIFNVGEPISILGIDNIRGMKPPYTYKINVYNATKNQWLNIDSSYEDKPQWIPKETGNYVLDIWIKSSDSTATYEAWKLKSISVKNIDDGGSKGNTGNMGNIASNFMAGPNEKATYVTYDKSIKEMADIQLSMPNNNGGPVYNFIDPSTRASKWLPAPREKVEYYLNPANFINSSAKYQFLKLDYSEGVSSDDLNRILMGKGVLEGKGQVFLEAAKANNISPIYLVAHSLFETGNGKSELAKGIEVRQINTMQVLRDDSGKSISAPTGLPIPVLPRVVYNLFGINALDSNPNVFGSEYAYSQNWFSVDDAIRGGAQYIAKGYISKGQNTLYKMRWNPSNPGKHQYASDVGWATDQVGNIKQLVDQCKNSIFVYEIPQFKP